jgi:starch-binding outer membrane protein, SusD/RagB family
MKKISLTYMALACLLVATSCSDFLNVEPKTQLTEDEVFGDEKNIELLVSGLYTQWRNTKQDRGGFMFTLGTDEAQQGGQQVRENAVQAALDKYDGQLNGFNTSLSEQWDKRWPVVVAAAKAAKYASSDALKAQASFIRATMTFELGMLWGPIPLIDIDDMRTGREPIDEVFKFIIKDLEYAVANLPETQSDPKIPTRGAAQALLGKVYMYAPVESGVRDFAKAIEYFDMAIPRYSLMSNYGDLFNAQINQSSTESIYAFHFNNIYPDNNMCQHHTGSRAVADIDGKCYFGGYDLIMPTSYYSSDEADGGIWEDGDVRKNASIRYDFTLPNGTVPGKTWTGMDDELGPHTRKYEDIRTQGLLNFWYSGGTIYYLRLADILLCKAECLNEINQTSNAVDLVNNTVRARAWGGTLPDAHKWNTGMSKEDFRVNILDERMRELAFEGWRRMDLIRTGNLVEYVKERNPWAKAAGAINEHHTRYPIPESEIQLNDLIEDDDQNPGY